MSLKFSYAKTPEGHKYSCDANWLELGRPGNLVRCLRSAAKEIDAELAEKRYHTNLSGILRKKFASISWPVGIWRERGSVSTLDIYFDRELSESELEAIGSALDGYSRRTLSKRIDIAARSQKNLRMSIHSSRQDYINYNKGFRMRRNHP